MMARDKRVEIELDDIESTEQLHVRLMKKLRFPDWHGRNWDAFRDAITALVDMPLILRLKGWPELERRFPPRRAADARLPAGHGPAISGLRIPCRVRLIELAANGKFARPFFPD
jgi:RNAse (barnase) inhibitor barstar